MHTETLKQHSRMKTRSDEQRECETWRRAQDNPTKRVKKATPVMRCPQCDCQYSHTGATAHI